MVLMVGNVGYNWTRLCGEATEQLWDMTTTRYIYVALTMVNIFGLLVNAY